MKVFSPIEHTLEVRSQAKGGREGKFGLKEDFIVHFEPGKAQEVPDEVAKPYLDTFPNKYFNEADWKNYQTAQKKEAKKEKEAITEPGEIGEPLEAGLNKKELRAKLESMEVEEVRAYADEAGVPQNIKLKETLIEKILEKV